MAEALGIAASVVTLTALAAKVNSAFHEFRAVQELPARLFALDNEVTDFQVVLRHVSTVLTEREPPPDDVLAKVSAKLKRAENLLMDIDESIRHVDQNCVRGKKFISRAAVW